MMTELFQQALHINAPWLIKSIDFNAEEKRLDIHQYPHIDNPCFIIFYALNSASTSYLL
jgi:hypothetical protein